jgi:hypothetical protein
MKANTVLWFYLNQTFRYTVDFPFTVVFLGTICSKLIMLLMSSTVTQGRGGAFAPRLLGATAHWNCGLWVESELGSSWYHLTKAKFLFKVRFW